MVNISNRIIFKNEDQILGKVFDDYNNPLIISTDGKTRKYVCVSQLKCFLSHDTSTSNKPLRTLLFLARWFEPLGTIDFLLRPKIYQINKIFHSAKPELYAVKSN